MSMENFYWNEKEKMGQYVWVTSKRTLEKQCAIKLNSYSGLFLKRKSFVNVKPEIFNYQLKYIDEFRTSSNEPRWICPKLLSKQHLCTAHSSIYNYPTTRTRTQNRTLFDAKGRTNLTKSDKLSKMIQKLVVYKFTRILGLIRVSRVWYVPTGPSNCPKVIIRLLCMFMISFSPFSISLFKLIIFPKKISWYIFS